MKASQGQKKRGYTPHYLLLFLVMTLSSCLSDRPTIVGEGDISTVTYPEIKGFDQIKASSVITVKVQQDTTEAVSLSINSNLLPYVKVKQQGRQLILDMDNKFDYEDAEVLVTVSMPQIRSIELSEAAEANFTGDWIAEACFIAMSGVSVLKGLSVTAPKTTITLSGVCELSATCNSVEMALAASGSCDSDIDLQGNSNCHLNLSGTSSVALRGKCQSLKAIGSGMTEIDAKYLYCSTADMTLSGMSDAEVNVDKSISYVLTGLSGIDIRGNAVVDRHKASSMASVKRHK